MKKKYDCTKTSDFAHEAKRMCDYYCIDKMECRSCPLFVCDCDIDKITDRVIDTVQKWSDEHPEDDYIRILKSAYGSRTLFKLDLKGWDGDVVKAYCNCENFLVGNPCYLGISDRDRLARWLIKCAKEKRDLCI